MVDLQKTTRWRRIIERCLDIAWRPTCLLCAGPGESPLTDLCAACEAELPANLYCCRVCAQPLQSGNVDMTCGACLKRKPRFDTAICVYRYAYPLDHLVHSLKYGGALAPARVLAGLLARRIAASGTRCPSLLIPVPLSASRFRRRGYNQAIELARHLRRHLGVAVCTDLVTRIRDTPEQAGLNRKQRRRNLRGAFAVSRRIPGAHVAIVDDVVTTGSTANELAKVLKRAGAKRVDVWAVARAGRT
jgi:ComF family protein